MSGVLDRICEDKRRHVAERKAELPPQRVESAARRAPPARPFAEALAAAAADGSGLIAEIKRASPSRGLIRTDFDVPTLARAYERGGATCLSVVTDTPHFQGQDADLTAARQAVALPVLRKDFMLDPYQIFESRALGADCVLLIMAVVDDPSARQLAATAKDLGMDVLVEVHDGAEMDRALALDSRLIGVNHRDLKTLKVDIATTEKLAPKVPPERILISESGLHGPADLARMVRAGATCCLVGESLMRQDDVEAATRALLAVPEAEAASA